MRLDTKCQIYDNPSSKGLFHRLHFVKTPQKHVFLGSGSVRNHSLVLHVKQLLKRGSSVVDSDPDPPIDIVAGTVQLTEAICM